MNDDELREELGAFLDRLCEESDDPATALAFRAGVLAAQDWDEKSGGLTREEFVKAAVIDAWLEWMESQNKNADWQTSKTKIGKPGLTH